jgi:hypothetical protein
MNGGKGGEDAAHAGLGPVYGRGFEVAPRDRGKVPITRQFGIPHQAGFIRECFARFGHVLGQGASGTLLIE